MAGVKTLEEAYEFVVEAGICTLFSEGAEGVASLWEAVDLPHRSGGKTKWGARIEAIWAWKNELPATYPDDIFYGKIPGGLAALMSMEYLRSTHYPAFHRPVKERSELARHVYDIARLSPATTAELRREAMDLRGCSKGRFEAALKELQVTLNLARSNDPAARQDTWLPFAELYPGFED